MLKFELIKEVPQKIPKKFFEEIIFGAYKVIEDKVESYLEGRDGLIDIVLVDDARIQELNKEYRGNDKPTDVIAFAYLEVTDFKKEEGEVIAGDIFISVDTALSQAKTHKHTLKDEIKLLLVHGILHLFGFDHNTDEEEEQMEFIAKQILSQI
ncbi:rRNA maturation RNase YbeY [Candidatus Peregrinibacteria bacterium]|nr:rRNA maturation RNase YbeY [Candidatus Peregrinibacteria bacterium]